MPYNNAPKGIAELPVCTKIFLIPRCNESENIFRKKKYNCNNLEGKDSYQKTESITFRPA
jgi:hypothetical protein